MTNIFLYNRNGVCYVKDWRDKTIMKFDVPKISEIEQETRKKIDELWENI